jgi:hypothetical protein
LPATHNAVSGWQAKRDVMRAEHERPVGEERPLQAGKHGLGGVRVDGAEAVVDEEVPGSTVDGAGERHPGLLTAAQRQAAFSDLGQVAVRKDEEIGPEAAAVEDLLIAQPIERQAEKDVVADLKGV